MDGRPLPGHLADADRAFLERLIAAASADERVAALFLGGSHARGDADDLSDLDLYLITTDAGFAAFRAERRHLMRELGDVVFLEEHEDFGFLMLLYMYADGVHGEVAVAPARDLAGIHAGAYHTLVDKHRLLADRDFPAWRLDADARRDVTRRLLVWFWYDRRLLDVALARDRLWTAHYYLERCRQACVNLARLRAVPDVWPGGYEKAEGAADAETLAALVDTVVPLDTQEMRRAAGSVTRTYLEVGRQVADLQAVAFPERLASTVSAALRAGP